MNYYEACLIVDPKSKQEEIEEGTSKIEQFITARGGRLKETKAEGIQRLTYPVDKKNEGIYLYLRFDLPEDQVSELTKHFNLSSFVRRNFITKQERPKEVPPKEKEELEKVAVAKEEEVG